tara:strand:+ start:511 stop:849 length:339 start_codon:yes stop_codon:yes gene_type:complete
MKNKEQKMRKVPPLQFWKVRKYFLDCDMNGNLYRYRGEPCEGNGIGFGGEDGLYQINEKKYPNFTDEDWDLLNDNYFELLDKLNEEIPTILSSVIDNHQIIETLLEEIKNEK